MDEETSSLRTVRRLAESVQQRHSAILTGPAGSGKTYVIRQLNTVLAAQYSRVAFIVGTNAGSQVPLGAFAGVQGMPEVPLHSPATVVDAFARHRSETVVIVDNVDLLDDASLYVVTQLITTTQMPTILTVRDLGVAPQSVRDLYDSGDLAEFPLAPLAEPEAVCLLRDLVGGELTPRAQAQILAAGEGNPMRLREIVRGSQDDARLVQTPHGWDLIGPPAPTQRLAGLMAERFRHLTDSAMEAATLVALVGECPISALNEADRHALAQAHIIDVTECGWVRLLHPLDGEYLQSWCSPALHHEIVHRAIGLLRGTIAATRPHAHRQADMVALHHGCHIDETSMVTLAEYALGSYDVRLALHAATAVIAKNHESFQAHRVAGQAASLLGHIDTADSHFYQAQQHAQSDEEKTSVALARAQHLGIRHHDATAALMLVQETLTEVSDTTAIAQLQGACVQWSAVAGLGSQVVSTPEEPASYEGAMSLITAGVSGVITGRLQETHVLLPAMKQVSPELLVSMPGGDALVELTEIMALSYSGDVHATRKRMIQTTASFRETKPETLGTWEYARGFLELLSADADTAHTFAKEAVTHLAWRDSGGLLPAAHALMAATSMATGRSIDAHQALARIPDSAQGDPKVVMLQGWVQAWQAKAERRTDQCADTLLTTAQRLMHAQHTYFAGMLAHCVARMGRSLAESQNLLHLAYGQAGGGLLHLFVRHVDAVIERDIPALQELAGDAAELGLITTAADTRLWLSDISDRRTMTETMSRQNRLIADELCLQTQAMALWNAEPDRSTLLTEREHCVVRLAADRYTAKEIAEINNVSVNTVTNQLTSAFRKLGVNSRAELRELLGASAAPTRH